MMPARAAFVLCACLIAAGCASSPRPASIIHDSPRGSVFLEQIRSTSFQATHPVTIETVVIARALRGIHVLDDRRTLQTLFGSQPEPVRAFSDEDADFLAPFISTAFTRVAPGQQIGFRIDQAIPPADPQHADMAQSFSESTANRPPEAITSGILFAYGRSLQIHLTRFRSGIEPRSMIDGPNRHYVDQTGLTGRKLAFVPREAERPETFRVGETGFPTLVLDYGLLAALPDQPVAPAPAQATGAPATPAGRPAASAEEIEALKKELQEIKQQLQEQKKDHPKQKNKPAP
jgi:hypothetical protein